MKDYDLYIVHKVVDGFGHDDCIKDICKTKEDALKSVEEFLRQEYVYCEEEYLEERKEDEEAEKEGRFIARMRPAPTLEEYKKYCRYISKEEYESEGLSEDNYFITGYNFNSNIPVTYSVFFEPINHII